MAFADEFWKMVSEAGSVTITSHVSPDDDAIGSVLGLNLLITKKYSDKRVEMVISSEQEDGRYKSFLNFEKIKFVPDLTECLEGVDLLIMADGSHRYRFSGNGEGWKKFFGKTICIDHHGTDPEQFDLAQIDSKAASCSGLIFELLADEKDMDIETARVFLLGILGDSGNFQYLRPDQMRDMEIGKSLLMKLGKSMQDFNAEYATISPRIFELIRKMIESTEFKPETGGWPAWQWAGIDREYGESGNFSEAEISQASHIYMDNFLRWVSGYMWGVVMTPKSDGRYNLSLRSLSGSVNVRKLMEKMGVGGGHDRAAGGTVVPDEGKILVLDEVKAKFETWISTNPNDLEGN